MDVQTTPFVKLPTKTYFVENGRIVTKTDGLKAMEQHIDKVLTTERYHDVIYTPFFGIELIDVLGRPSSFVRGVIKKRVTQALMVDERIQSIEQFEIVKVDGDILHVSFVVKTIFGNFKKEGVWKNSGD